MCIRDSSIMGLKGGVVEKGSPADLTIFSTEYKWTIDRNIFNSKAGNTPFHGFHVKGAVFYTIVDGKVVFSREL